MHASQALPDMADILVQEIGPHRHRHFGGRGRRRRAPVGSQVDQGVSVSWPTAEISGIALSAAARTTISSLKA